MSKYTFKYITWQKAGWLLRWVIKSAYILVWITKDLAYFLGNQTSMFGQAPRKGEQISEVYL